MIWIALAVVCAVSVASRDYVIKGWCDDVGRLVLVALFIPEGVGLLWLANWPSVQGILDVSGYLGVSVALNLTALLAFWKALQYSDLSLTMPAKALTPVALLFIAPLIVGEVPSMLTAAGAGVVAAGGLVMAPTVKPKDYRALWPILLALVCWSSVASVDAIGARQTSSLFWAGATRTLWGGVAALAVIARKGVQTGVDSVRPVVVPLIAISFLSAISAFTQLEAMQTADVVNVIAVKRLSIVVAVLLGGLSLKETSFKQRLAGATLMVAGAILVTLTG